MNREATEKALQSLLPLYGVTLHEEPLTLADGLLWRPVVNGKALGSAYVPFLFSPAPGFKEMVAGEIRRSFPMPVKLYLRCRS